MQSHYKIAGISIRVDAPTELSDNEGFSLYRVPPQPEDYSISLIPDQDFAIPPFDGKPVFSDPMHLVLQGEGKCLHLFRIPSTRGVSAWNWLEPGNSLEIHYHPGAESYYLNSTGCFNCAGIERILFEGGKFLFHCSYVDDRGGGVLFSAPSGGGKTTQASLWERYAGATMVNGDRAVLEKNQDGYAVHGLPIAGSSGVFLNRSLPLKAIFIVKKAAENRAVRLSQQEAFQAVFSELTINTWNHPFVLSTVDFAMNLAAKLPVFRLECRIDQGAVEAAKRELEQL